MTQEPRIGFACLWDPEPEGTWSRTPWNLRAAMRDQVAVVDLPVSPRPLIRNALRATHLRYRRGRLVSLYEQSVITDEYCRRAVNRAIRRDPCDVVVEIQDLADVGTPFVVYQDMSFDSLRRAHEESGLPWQGWLTAAEVDRRRRRQLRIYERAVGVVAMSHWLADSLVRDTGLPSERVHVVHPGINALMCPTTTNARAEAGGRGSAPRRRLLTIGRGDMRMKGIDLTVAALAVLRTEVDPDITLTIAGPARWQLDGDVPDGVDFLGFVDLAQVDRLMDTHDLFVLPSRLEAFGIAFVEALARGLPCVGRRSFAMPEIIEPGVGGDLFSGEDPVELAHMIARCLADDGLYAACRAGSAGTAERFSWDRAGAEMVEAASATLHSSVRRPVLSPDTP